MQFVFYDKPKLVREQTSVWLFVLCNMSSSCQLYVYVLILIMAKTQTEMRTVGYNFVVKYFFHLPILVYMLFFFELRIKFLDLSMHVAITLNQVLVASVIKSYVVA